MNAAPLSRNEVEVLARYNGERLRGISHDPEFAAAMAELQRRFDEIGYRTLRRRTLRRAEEIVVWRDPARVSGTEETT